MSDRLEDFIRQHRDEFDEFAAPPAVWRRINMETHKVRNIWRITAIAASALLLISVGFIAGTRVSTKPDIAGWSQYLETEQYYQSRIHQKMEEIKLLNVNEEVLNDMDMLDHIYQEMRIQLTEDPNADPEKLINAMIRHQQHKLEIMEKILNRVDKYRPYDQQIRQM